MRNAPRVRVGSATVCPWRSDTTASSNTPASSPSEDRLIGVFAGHIVTYERSPARLLVRQLAHNLPSATNATSGNEDQGVAMSLPEEMGFASHQGDNARFVLMWSHNGALRKERNDEDETTKRQLMVYVGDIESKSLVSTPVSDYPVTTTEGSNGSSSTNNWSLDGAVDSSGENVALVSAARGRVWYWAAPKSKLHAHPTEAGGWKQRLFGSPSCDNGDVLGSSKPLASCATGRYVNSSLLGHCFMLMRVSWYSGATVLIEKWIFDIEMGWRTLKTSSITISVESLKGMDNAQATMQLRMNRKWTHGALAIDNTMIGFAVHVESLPTMRSSVHSCIMLEKKIVDLAWIDESDILALLLADGQMMLVSSTPDGSLNLHDIESQSTTSKQLRLNTLMSRVASSASRLLWISEEGELLVQTGSGAVIFPIEIFRDETQAKSAEELTIPQRPARSEIRNAGSLRRRLQRRTCSDTRVDDELRSHFDQSASPSTVALLEIARIALYESTADFQDVFFTLVIIIYQQLKSVCMLSSESAQIEEEGIDQQLLEVVLSLIFSAESNFLQRFASTMLSAPAAFTSRAERRIHYRSEMDELAQINRALMTGSDDEDQGSSSPNRAAFLDIYLPKISSLLEAFIGNASCEEQSRDAKSSLEFSQWTLGSKSEAVLQEAQQALSKKSQTTLASTSSSLSSQRAVIRDSLLLVFVSYAIASTCLRVDSVRVDLQHLLSVAQLRQKPLKRERLACFVTNWSRPTDLAISGWSLETALKFVRATQTIGTLVDFCTASKSLFANECLKEICILQAKLFLNSKNILVEKRVEVTRQFESLHLQICESYIGEMTAMLREVPLVSQFKHSIKSSGAIHSDAFGSTEGVVTQRFEVFTKCILTEMDDVDGGLPAFRKHVRSKRFWKHSSRETRVRSRCLRLKSRILWHLKQLATCDEQSLVQIFERIFLIDFLSGRCGNTEEAKLIAKFIDKAQDAVSCDQWQQKQLSFDNYQRLFNESRGSQSHYRVDKIMRSLALLVWAIWIRERCGYCLRSIELLKGHDFFHKDERSIGSETEKKRLGSLAATCALQLNVLGILVGKPDDIFALQISLLEEAAKLNPEKAVAVICWAFPADKIQARYLKRYKSLRQVLKADSRLSTDAPPIEETEHRCQFIQRHVKRSIRWSITSGSMKPGPACMESPRKHEVSRAWTIEIDVLVDCCCDLEFQKITWALIQKKFAGESRVTEQQNGDLGNSSSNECSAQLKKMLAQSHSSTAEGVISRKKVMLLLQEQKRELEGKVRSWSTTSYRQANGNEAVETAPLQPTISQEEKEVRIQQASSNIKSTKTSYTIRDIDPRSNGDELKSPSRKRKQSHQTERQESVQNVLKLLNLRKQRGSLSDHRSDNLPNLSNQPEAQRFQPRSQRGATSGPAPTGVESVPSPKRHARESDRHRMANAAPLDEDEGQIRVHESRGKCIRSDSAPIVFSLRSEAGMDKNSCMKLLGRRTSGNRSIPLKAKQFSFQQRESPPKDDDRVQAWNGILKHISLADEATVNLKTTGAQTDDTLVENKPAVAVKVEHNSDQCIGNAYVKNDTATQAESGENAIAAKDTHEASIQCLFRGKMGRELVSADGNGAKFETRGIFDKFPVFVELDESKKAHDMPKKFLQVTRIADHMMSQNDESSEEKILTVTAGMNRLMLPSNNKTNQSKSETKHNNNAQFQTPAITAIPVSHTLRRGASKTDLLVTHQTRYRNHFSMHDASCKPEQPNRKGSISNGRSSLIGLKEDMERLKTRLAQLEHCADEIDEDFKDSHHKLERIEKEHDSHELAAHTRLLDTIDNTLKEMNGGDLDPLPTTSVLSKKALKDIGAARKLIETIEQIALDDTRENGE